MYIILIFKYSQRKPKPFGVKINIDLEATSVERKLTFIWPIFTPFRLNTGVTHGPLLPPKKTKPMGY